MSRPLPTTITSNELENDSGIKVAGKITVYNNRIFSDSINLDNCPGDWVPRVYTRNINTITGIDDNAYILDRPVPQDCCWDPATGKLWTVFNVANGIFLMCNGSYNYTRLCDVSGNQYMCYPMCKPAIFPGIIYITDWTGNVIKYTYDFASAVGAPTLNATSATTINSLGYFGTLHTIDSNAFAHLYDDDGGVGITIYNDSGTHTWPYRWIWPDRGWSNVDKDSGNIGTSGSNIVSSDMWNLVYSAAVADQNGNIFFYITDPYGQIMGVKYSVVNGLDTWSDPFLAVPADVSIFYIGNALCDPQGHIHLVGQFLRTDDYAGEFIHNLDLWSLDGYTFSIDRWTSISTSGYRFLAVYHDNTLTFTDFNRFITGNAPFSWLGRSTPDFVTIPTEDIRTLAGNDSGIANSDWPVALASGDYSYRNNPLLTAKGNVAILQIGMYDSTGALVYFDYEMGITSKFQSVDRDEYHGGTLTFTEDGIYRIGRMTHPFYLEILAKEAFYSTIETGDFSPAALNGSDAIPLNVNMWGDQTLWDGGGLGALSHDANDHKDILSTDIMDYLSLVQYPAVPANTFTLKMYAWSRIGLPDQNPNVADPTPLTNPNDTIQPIFIIRRTTNGVVETSDRAVVIDTSCSANPRPPYDVGTGSFTGVSPVVYTIPVDGSAGLLAGDVIKQIGFRFASTSATVFYPERIESTDITVYQEQSAPSWTYDSSPTQSIFAFNTTTDPWVMDHDDANAGAYTIIHAGVGHNNDGCLQIQPNINPGDTGPATHAYASLTLDGSKSIVGQMAQAWVDTGNTFGSFRIMLVYSDNSFDISSTELAGNWSWNQVQVIVSSQNAGKSLSYLKIGLFIDGSTGFDPNFTIYIDDVVVPGQYPNADMLNPSVAINTETLSTRGIPSVMFCTTPNTAFNFKITGKFSINGGNSWAGLVGFGKDSLNYIVGRVSLSKVQICSYVSGTCNILATMDYAGGVSGETVEYMFFHRDGLFGMCPRVNGTWQDPVLTYRASLANEGIPYLVGVSSGDVITSTSDTAVADFYHVGFYGLIECPRFRTAGFDVSAGSIIPVLPGSDQGLDFSVFSAALPGQVEIDEVIYNYTGVIPMFVGRGPFQVRSEMNWSFKDPSDGESYGGPSMDITWFQWLNDPTHHADYVGKLLAIDSEVCYTISDTDWRAYITTGGQWVQQRDRSRWYSTSLDPDNDSVSCSEKAWITYGLTGVTLAPNQDASLVTIHEANSVVNLIQYPLENSIIESFSAANGERESTVKDMLKRVGALAGARTRFRGDKIISSQTVSPTPTSIWTEQ